MGLDYQISLSGLRAGELLMQTAQNNIANASNTSYARESVELNTVNYPAGNTGINAQLGSGVTVEQINRITSDLLTQQSRTENSLVNYYSAKNDTLTDVENIFDETGDDSISSLMSNFFNSFEEASNYPDQTSYRLSAVYAGQQLSEKIRTVASEMNTAEQQNDTKITSDATQINTLLGKIADVNTRMQSVSSDNPNTLLDERDQYIDQLSQYMDVQVVNDSTNPMNIEIKSGNTTLLAGKNVYQINPMFVQSQNKWVLSASDIEFVPKNGTLAADLETRNVTLPKYENGLNTLVTNLISQVNAQHSSGYGLDGTTGMNFFLGTDMNSISVDPTLEQNPEKLALSSENGVEGNSDTAKAISNLQNNTIVNGQTPNNYYQEYTDDLASELNTSKENEQIHTEIHTTMESQRQSVQGVNIDEEMTNVLNYQKFYQANAKVLTTTDKMLDDLFNAI